MERYAMKRLQPQNVPNTIWVTLNLLRNLDSICLLGTVHLEILYLYLNADLFFFLQGAVGESFHWTTGIKNPTENFFVNNRVRHFEVTIT